MAGTSLRSGMVEPYGGSEPVALRLARRRPLGPRRLGPHPRLDRRERLVAVSATVTIIDRSRGIVPRAFDRVDTSSVDPLHIAKLAQLQDAARGRDAHGILELALKGEFA